MMKRTEWFERRFTFGLPSGMLPFYLERLSGTAVRVAEKIKGLSDELLSHPLDGKWSIKQNIGHLTEVDGIAMKRIHEITHGISPMSSAVFALRIDHNSLPIDNVLADFRVNRKKNILRYAEMSDEELARTAIHPRLNVPMTVVDLAWFDAEHDDHHMVRINEIIIALSK